MSTVIPKTQGLVTLRYVVMSVLNRLQDYSLKRYKFLAQIAIEGFTEELSMFHIDAGTEVVYLHMSTAKTVALPSDFVDYLKVGYPINGKLKVITRNDNILLPRVFDDGTAIGNTTVNDTTVLSGAVFFQDHYRNGQFVGGLFGMQGGIDDCYFRVDRENHQLVFSGETPRSEIVLEYLSSGLKVEGGSLIPRECVAALRTYVLWQSQENDSRVAYNAKERLKREHDEAVAALRSFQSSFTASEYLQMVYQSYTQSPKR